MRCETSPDEPQISQEETVEEETVEITDQTSNSSQNGEQNVSNYYKCISYKFRKDVLGGVYIHIATYHGDKHGDKLNTFIAIV